MQTLHLCMSRNVIHKNDLLRLKKTISYRYKIKLL